MKNPQRLKLLKEYFSRVINGEITCTIRPSDDTGSLRRAVTNCRSYYGDGRHHIRFGPLILESEDGTLTWMVNVFGTCVIPLNKVPESFFVHDGCGSLEAFKEIETAILPTDPVTIIMFERIEDAN